MKIKSGSLIRILNGDRLWCKSGDEVVWLDVGQILTVSSTISGSFGNFSSKISTVEGIDIFGADDDSIEVLPPHQKIQEFAMRVLKHLIGM